MMVDVCEDRHQDDMLAKLMDEKGWKAGKLMNCPG